MVKRSGGLGQRTKNKRLKTDSADSEQNTEDFQDGQVSVAIDENIDESDEMGQLYALDKTYAESKKSSPKLLYGIVHECDRILRNCKSPESELSAKFYNVYASALVNLAPFATSPQNEKSSTPQDTSRDFIQAALERVESGLEQYADDAQLLQTRAKIQIASVDDSIKNASNKGRAEAALATEKNLLAALNDFDKSSKTGEVPGLESVELVEAVVEIGEGLSDLADSTKKEETKLKLSNLQQKLLDWTQLKWQSILEASKDESVNQKAKSGMAHYYVAKATPYMDLIEEFQQNDDEDEDEEPSQELKNAIKEAKILLSDAHKYASMAEDETDGETFAFLGEVQISLANLYDVDSEEQKDLYKKAVNSLKRAQRLGYGNFQEQIADLEDEEDESNA